MRLDIPAFRETLRRCFPDLLDRADPGFREAKVTFVKEETLADWPAPDRRRLGLVAEAQTPDGRKTTFLVQPERRPGNRTLFERRLLRYYLWLLVGRRQPVRLIVVYLEGKEPGIRNEALVEKWGGIERLRVPYTAIVLGSGSLTDPTGAGQ